MPDFTTVNNGTIWLLRPVTDAADEWVRDNLPDFAMRFGGAVAIEARYIEAIIHGIEADGLDVE